MLSLYLQNKLVLNEQSIICSQVWVWLIIKLATLDIYILHQTYGFLNAHQKRLVVTCIYLLYNCSVYTTEFVLEHQKSTWIIPFIAGRNGKF